MSNSELYQKALDAITTLFGDTSVSQAQAKRNLNALMSEIETMIETLPDEEDVD